MSSTLVISDNDLLNQLYSINFEVYLATKVKLVTSIQEAQSLIENGNTFDLILTMNMINGQDSAETIFEFLKIKNLNIPLIVIGNHSGKIESAIFVQSSYNLENLLRSSAEILGVTSKEMASLPLPQYFEVEAKFLLLLKRSPCQIFLQIKQVKSESNYTLVADKDSDMQDSIQRLVSEGIECLYVNKRERLIIVNHISTELCKLLQESNRSQLPVKTSALESSFQFVASGFCQSPEAIHEVVNLANECTKMMEEISNEATGLAALTKILKSNKTSYAFLHSILASYVATHIIRNIPWGGEGQIEKINFVLFFHDIMLAPIYLKYPELKFEEDLLFSDLLSDKEKEIVLNHAKLAAELILSYRKAPMGVDLLIKQHHGMTSGVGFAHEFREDISPLSKIVLISEAFVEEYFVAKAQDPNFRIDLKKMISILIEKFNRSTYKKIINTLETIRL